MALFRPNAEAQQIELDVTIFEGDDNNPPIVVRMRAISERKYQQLTPDFITRDRKDIAKGDLMKGEWSGEKIGQHYAEHIVMFDEQGLVRMSGLTIGNQVRLDPQHPPDEADRQKFYHAGPEGVRLSKQEFIWLCMGCPSSVAVPMLNEYLEQIKNYGTERSVVEEAQRKNSLNGPVAALESAAS